MEKLTKAVRNEFYYEAIFIEYAILEDRTESLLRHASYKTKNIDGNNISLYEKINKINLCSKFNDKYIKKHITIDFMNKIDNWRKKRNKLIHDLINCSYKDEHVKIIADEGYEIVKKMNSKTTMVNKFLDTMNN